MKVVVIGSGPSGLMCAGTCAKNGHEVVVVDKNEKSGKKLYITGKGRCNVTNLCETTDFFNNIVTNPKFLFSAIQSFSPKDTYDFFENNKVQLKVERGNRVFPISDKASDITKALVNYCKGNGVSFIFDTNVKEIKKINETFILKTNSNNIICDCVVLACGGKSYSTTGSDGSGYILAESLGHNITNIRPALCPILLKDSWVKDVEGISLKNVELIVTNQNNKILYNEFGEMIFTRNGISGPIALTISSYINKLSNISLYIDFKPALSEEKLESRLIREFESNTNAQISTVIRSLLPKNLVPIFLKTASIGEQLKVNQITINLRKRIINFLKHFPICYNGLDKIDYAIVTSGGVDIKEINPKTMESKIQKNLYIVGELLDVDALTGGFNIQIALSTGFQAGKSIL